MSNVNDANGNHSGFSWLLSQGYTNKDVIRIKGSRRSGEYKTKGVSMNIGRVPNGWLKAKGKKITPEGQLSISELLSELRVNKHTADIFPWAFSNNSYWIYYAYFNGSNSFSRSRYADSRRNTLAHLLDYLKDKYDLNRTGVGRRAKSKGQWKRAFDSARSSHRIENCSNETSELFKRIRKRVTKDVPVFKTDVKRFKKLWITQSKELSSKLPHSKTHSIGSFLFHLSNEVNPTSSFHIIDTLSDKFISTRFSSQKFIKIFAAYYIIRALYGTSFDEEDKKNTISEIKNISQKGLRLIDRSGISEEKYASIYQDLRLSKGSGIPQRREEAIEISEVKETPIFRVFRFNSFIKINQQIYKVLNEY
jgi:hypothetical protein